jgi:hypothetical protein
MKNYNDVQLLERVEGLDTFTGWHVGVYDIWVRFKDNDPNKFNDKVYTYDCIECGKRPKFIMVCTGTTEAGTKSLLNFERYNKNGTAVLKSDTIVYNSHIAGRHRDYQAYRQNKSFPHYRDNNKNTQAEEIGEVYEGIIYANCHKAGTFSTLVDGWSAGCLVRNVLKQWDRWYRFMNKRNLSVTILKEF